MAGFFDEFFDEDFYEPVAATDHEQRFGRLYTTHTYFPHQNVGFWRPGQTDQTQTSAREFIQVPIGECRDPFNHLTLHSPKLESNEEFLVLRVKNRPVVMLVPQIDITDVDRSNRGSPVSRKMCLVAQVYSTTQQGVLKFKPEFIDNVRQLKYPQAMFLPEKAGALVVDSLVRLDECQSVFSTNLTAIPFQLGKDIREELRSQFFFLFEETDDGVFTGNRQMLAEL